MPLFCDSASLVLVNSLSGGEGNQGRPQAGRKAGRWRGKTRGPGVSFLIHLKHLLQWPGISGVGCFPALPSGACSRRRLSPAFGFPAGRPAPGRRGGSGAGPGRGRREAPAERLLLPLGAGCAARPCPGTARVGSGPGPRPLQGRPWAGEAPWLRRGRAAGPGSAASCRPPRATSPAGPTDGAPAAPQCCPRGAATP